MQESRQVPRSFQGFSDPVLMIPRKSAHRIALVVVIHSLSKPWLLQSRLARGIGNSRSSNSPGGREIGIFDSNYPVLLKVLPCFSLPFSNVLRLGQSPHLASIQGGIIRRTSRVLGSSEWPENKKKKT